MSAIARPRLYFRGHTWWDPSTFNNNDNFPTYDAANVRLNMPYLYTQGVYAPEQFRRWAITSSSPPSIQITPHPAHRSTITFGEPW